MLRKIKLLGDKGTQLTYNEFIGSTFRNLKEGDSFVSKVNLYDPLIKAFRKTKVLLSVVNVDDKQIDVEVNR